MLEVMLDQFDVFTKWPKKTDDRFRLVEKLEGSAGIYGVGDKMEYIKERQALKDSYFASEEEIQKVEEEEE